MTSRSELLTIFPLLVERHTDEKGYTDWYAVAEYLQCEEFTTVRNRVWKWRNAETWWLRNRGRILANSAPSEPIEPTAEANPVQIQPDESDAVDEAFAGGWGCIERFEQPIQLALSFQ